MADRDPMTARECCRLGMSAKKAMSFLRLKYPCQVDPPAEKGCTPPAGLPPHAQWLEEVIMAIQSDDAERIVAAFDAAPREAGELSASEEGGSYGIAALSTKCVRPVWRESLAYGGDATRSRFTPFEYGFHLSRRWGCMLSELEVGDTALHLAARNAAPRCVRQLLKLGANACALNRVGKTPLMVTHAACIGAFDEQSQLQRPPTPADQAPAMLGNQKLDSEEPSKCLPPINAFEYNAHPYSSRPDRATAAAVFHYLTPSDQHRLPQRCHVIVGFGRGRVKTTETEAESDAVQTAAAATERTVEQCCDLYNAGVAPALLLVGDAAEEHSLRAIATENGVPHEALQVVGVACDAGSAKTAVDSGEPWMQQEGDHLLNFVSAAIATLQREAALQESGLAPYSAKDPVSPATSSEAQVPCYGFLSPRFHVVLVGAPILQRRLWLHARRWLPPWVVLYNAPPQILVRERGRNIDYTFDAEQDRFQSAAEGLWGVLERELKLLEGVVAGDMQGSPRPPVPPPVTPCSHSEQFVRQSKAVFAARELIYRHYEVVGPDLCGVEAVRDECSVAELRKAAQHCGGGEDRSCGTLEQSVRALPTAELRCLLQDHDVDSRGMRTVLVPRLIEKAAIHK